MESDEVCRTTLMSGAVGKKCQIGSHSPGCRRLPRIVHKSGSYNINSLSSLSSRSSCKHIFQRLVVDAFVTLVDARWRYVIALFSGAFVVSWVVFALIWWFVVVVHGDDMHVSGSVEQNGNETTAPWRPCVSNVHDFNAALLFSVDLQTTTGFGFAEITTTCPAAIFLFMFQCAFGLLIEIVAVGVLVAKLVRPKRRSHTVLFSRHAVLRHLSLFDDTTDVSSRNADGGCLILQFRVADIRPMAARLTSVSLSAYAFLLNPLTETIDGGEQVFPVCRRSLLLSSNEKTCGRDASHCVSLLMLWPETLTHRVDKDSPLRGSLVRPMCSDEQGQGRNQGQTMFEIVVVLEGIDSATGRQMQARTSYSTGDLVWNRRLQSLSSRATSWGRWAVDLNDFHGTVDDRAQRHFEED